MGAYDYLTKPISDDEIRLTINLALKPEDRQFMRLLSCCVRPPTRQDIEEVFLHPLTTQSPTDVASPLVGDDESPLVGGVSAFLVPPQGCRVRGARPAGPLFIRPQP